MSQKLVASAAILGLLAVVIGAFGAHGLKQQISAEQLVSFETGVKYQIYHALLLLIIGLSPHFSDKSKAIILNLIIFGTILFSGSIYILSTREILGIDIRSMAFVTPIGGALLISSWVVLLTAALRQNHKIR